MGHGTNPHLAFFKQLLFLFSLFVNMYPQHPQNQRPKKTPELWTASAPPRPPRRGSFSLGISGPSRAGPELRGEALGQGQRGLQQTPQVILARARSEATGERIFWGRKGRKGLERYCWVRFESLLPFARVPFWVPGFHFGYPFFDPRPRKGEMGAGRGAAFFMGRTP